VNRIDFARSVAVLVAAALLAGCASLGGLATQVSSFSRWPAARPPASYAFERLPSQQTQPQQQQVLEDAARPAIEAAGFSAAGEGATPDVTIQIGARITATDRSPFDDPFWYAPSPFFRPFGSTRFVQPFSGPGWRYGGWGSPVYEREVAVLVRDKRSGEPLYEARASSEGLSSAIGSLLPAMFSAAMTDFPQGSTRNPHRVVIEAVR